MEKLINGQDSMISSAPTFCHDNPQLKTNSRIPQPFDKLTHITGDYKANSSDESDTPNVPSPLNRAWIDSPNSFIGKIPSSKILEGCCAFVDIWSREGNDNRSLVFARILSRMGATTLVRKFTKTDNVTHVVFHHGHKSFLKKAKSRNIKIVSCLWVERCRTTQTWVDEKEFIFDDAGYVPPKRFREMQPLEPDEELARSAERARRRQAREMNEARKAVAFLSPLATGGGKTSEIALRRQALACDTPYSTSSYRFIHPRLVAETPSDSIQRKLQRMREGKPIFSPPSSPISDSDSSQRSSTHKSDVDGQDTSTNHLEENTIASSQKSSDMDLTCLHPHSPVIGLCPPDGDGAEADKENKSPFNSFNSEDTPTIRLHLSDSSKSFNDHTQQSSSLHLRSEHESPPVSTTDPSLSSPEKKVHKNLPKKARRRLCQQDLDPASILLSPKAQESPQVVPRKSRRLSSMNASIAISNNFCRRSTCSNVGLTSACTEGSVSALPSPGHTLMKSSSTRGRYFEPIRSSTSCYNDSNSSSDEKSRRKPSHPSFSTAYEDNNQDESTHGVSSDHAVLAEVSSNLQDVFLRKRTRPSSSSTSGSSNENTRKPIKKTPKKHAKRHTAPPSKKVNKSINKSKIIQEITEPTRPRRSTEEFLIVPLNQSTARSQRHRTKRRKKKQIVLTSLHSDERAAMEQIVRDLGHFRVQSSVKDDRTSHVVCGAARRTLNVLHAIARGLWLLSKDWLLESKRAGRWLNEESFEVNYFPSAKQARLLRSNATSWALPLFRPVKGQVYVSPNTHPTSNELKELVTLCGGRVIGSPHRALIRVGLHVTLKDSLPAVKETWILDSISENTLKPMEDYWVT